MQSTLSLSPDVVFTITTKERSHASIMPKLVFFQKFSCSSHTLHFAIALQENLIIFVLSEGVRFTSSL